MSHADQKPDSTPTAADRFRVRSLREVGEFLGISPDGMKLWVPKGMPRESDGRGGYVYDLGEIVRWEGSGPAAVPPADDDVLTWRGGVYAVEAVEPGQVVTYMDCGFKRTLDKGPDVRR